MSRPFEANGTRGESLQPADGVEECRLAGSVRPDQSDDLALRHAERDLLDSLQPAEVDGETLDFEKRRAAGPGSHFVPNAAGDGDALVLGRGDRLHGRAGVRRDGEWQADGGFALPDHLVRFGRR